MAIISKLKSIGRGLKREVAVLRLILKHPRTPRLARVLLWLALGYLLLPFDIIPDWIPVLGQVDDLIIVPGLVLLAYKMIPKDVIAECRAKASPDQPENAASSAGPPAADD